MSAHTPDITLCLMGRSTSSYTSRSNSVEISVSIAFMKPAASVLNCIQKLSKSQVQMSCKCKSTGQMERDAENPGILDIYEPIRLLSNKEKTVRIWQILTEKVLSATHLNMG